MAAACLFTLDQISWVSKSVDFLVILFLFTQRKITSLQTMWELSVHFVDTCVLGGRNKVNNKGRRCCVLENMEPLHINDEGTVLPAHRSFCGAGFSHCANLLFIKLQSAETEDVTWMSDDMNRINLCRFTINAHLDTLSCTKICTCSF